jgi:Putative intracellular protease/amidase
MKSDLNALIVVTSHDQLGGTGRKTGFYYDEMAHPYWALVDAGLKVDIASIRGGAAPYDPGSLADEPDKRPPAVARFLADPASMEKIQNTRRIDDVDPDRYSVVFLPGGHGTMWDFPGSKALAEVVGRAYDRGAIVGAVCHGPSGLVGARRADGKPLVEGLRVNSFTNAEEQAVELADVVPFLLESRLRELGARFESAPNFQAKAVRDGRLVTGQNPASVALVAQELRRALEELR